MPKRARAECPCDYRSFENPYRGLSAMILVQAINDLQLLQGEETHNDHGYIVRKWEIINFFRSEWGEFLLSEFGLDKQTMRKVVDALCWKK